MKLQAEVDGSEYSVEITRDGDKIFARVDGRQYELEASEPEPNVYLLKHDGKIFEIFALPDPAAGSHINVQAGNTELPVTIIDPKRLRGSVGADENESGRAEIKTAMPGKVVRILVTENDSIQKGDGIIVVEAMKMQNEMKSPKDGVVTTIKVSEGDTVGAGDVLVVIE